MRSICVFCGANSGYAEHFKEITQQVGKELVRRELEVVYGAGDVGLMGVLADAILRQNGKITGVIPTFLKAMEVYHTGLTKLHEVQTMHQRKQKMTELSDAFLILPGGFGTLDEFFEILTWKQLRLHNKPIGLLNHKGYYDHLMHHIDVMVATGFLKPENRALVLVDTKVETLLKRMQNYKPAPTADKWLERS